MPEMRVEVALALDIPVEDAVGPGHHERLLGPFGHLVADEDLPEESLLGGLTGFDQIGEGVDGWHCGLASLVESPLGGLNENSLPLAGEVRLKSPPPLGEAQLKSPPPLWGRLKVEFPSPAGRGV